jgi:hypothetical protein
MNSVKNMRFFNRNHRFYSDYCRLQIQKLNINMKKIIFSLAVALLTVTGANAQKQEGGEHNLEVQFAPLGGSPISVNGIRYRMFLSESGALRVNSPDEWRQNTNCKSSAN